MKEANLGRAETEKRKSEEFFSKRKRGEDQYEKDVFFGLLSV